MRILALVPARGGSQRVPGKNLRVLGGRSLLAWSIEAARGITEICDILVSTDDEAIAAAARQAGALVPWLRPAELASDTATAVEVCLHALDWYQSHRGAPDGLLLLQPTSPLRRRATVERGIRLFDERSRRPVVSFSPAASHPLWCFRIEDGTARPFIAGQWLTTRSQDLPPAYVVNGALYLISPQHLRGRASFYSDDMVPLVIEDAAEAIDIDTEWDWMVAQAAVAAGRGTVP
jgi:CMP-N,N'-diacetyllegionaminic acid synthase